ncbi:2-C-methyl-D-erythritol 4-phosphate cytidylyltransferase [Haloactinospora alba]|uniref:2-C-methyl-D-erythritol 4-phosphate cytidylyltransferase n=1 Tax=Haloactinospora alba TaxID=405555 RepID=A0A543NEW0_9ACTN|nr:IspD/TarI family cytidylyltransferase [Haloactinospora alba]TQN30378.1 2-C-methyl-D-erythritol 4-phosphate cytidylyltransferase [Haloactinospora alba]
MPHHTATTTDPDTTRPYTIAAVLAGGVGARVGGTEPKQFLPLGGRTVLERAVSAFDGEPGVDEVLVLTVEEHLSRTERLVAEAGLNKVSAVLTGGATRTATSLAVLDALRGRPGTERILLHDAARPLVSGRTVRRCLEALDHAGAVGTAVPATDTVVRVEPSGSGTGEVIREVVPRSALRRMQTPQGFRLEVLRRAYDLALADPGFTATDDCGVVLDYTPEHEVRIVEGEDTNLKITNPGDLEIAETLLRRRGAHE